MKMAEIDENYRKEIEEIRKLDKGVWDATNKRAKPQKEKKVITPADKIAELQKDSK